MSQDNGRQLDDRLDAYLDGLLDPASRAEFEQRLASNPALRSELQRQRAIDEAIQNLYPVPAAQRAAAILEAARTRAVARAECDDPAAAPALRVRRVSRAVGWMAVAAGLVLLVGGWWVYRSLNPPGDLATGPTVVFSPMEPAAAIAKIEREKHEPDIVCDDDQQFAALAWLKTGQGLLLKTPIPPDLRIVGWSMKTVMSWKTLVLMVQSGDQWVYVLVDNISNDRSISMPAGSAYRVHRGQVGQVVLYEISPTDKPVVLDHFYDPQRDEAWYKAGVRW